MLCYNRVSAFERRVEEQGGLGEELDPQVRRAASVDR
jgi:hypothetical protein